jgi:hypothetical protein
MTLSSVNQVIFFCTDPSEVDGGLTLGDFHIKTGDDILVRMFPAIRLPAHSDRWLIIKPQ